MVVEFAIWQAGAAGWAGGNLHVLLYLLSVCVCAGFFSCDLALLSSGVCVWVDGGHFLLLSRLKVCG